MNEWKHIVLKISNRLECISELTGRCVSWLVLVLVLLVSYDVAMRYLFNSGSITIQELEWHIFSVIFLVGSAYTFKQDDHVRLDLLYQSRFSSEIKRAWINILGGIFLLIPFCILIIICSWPFISQSFIHNEGSPDPGGLPFRWILKSAIPLGFALLLLQGVADILKNLYTVLDRK